jgi:hypothetical protein
MQQESVAEVGPAQDDSFIVELKSASERYVDPGVGQVAYWIAPGQNELKAVQTNETYKPALSGQGISLGTTGRLDLSLPASTTKQIAIVCRAQTGSFNARGSLYKSRLSGYTEPYFSLFKNVGYAQIGNYNTAYYNYAIGAGGTATITWIVNSDNASATIYQDGVNKGNLAWGAGNQVSPVSSEWILFSSDALESWGNNAGGTVAYFAIVNRTLASSEISSFVTNLAAEYP